MPPAGACIDPLYLFCCGVLWHKQADASAGWELIHGLRSSGPERERLRRHYWRKRKMGVCWFAICAGQGAVWATQRRAIRASLTGTVPGRRCP